MQSIYKGLWIRPVAQPKVGRRLCRVCALCNRYDEGRSASRINLASSEGRVSRSPWALHVRCLERGNRRIGLAKEVECTDGRVRHCASRGGGEGACDIRASLHWGPAESQLAQIRARALRTRGTPPDRYIDAEGHAERMVRRAHAYDTGNGRRRIRSTGRCVAVAARCGGLTRQKAHAGWLVEPARLRAPFHAPLGIACAKTAVLSGLQAVSPRVRRACVRPTRADAIRERAFGSPSPPASLFRRVRRRVAAIGCGALVSMTNWNRLTGINCPVRGPTQWNRESV